MKGLDVAVFYVVLGGVPCILLITGQEIFSNCVRVHNCNPQKLLLPQSLGL